MNQTAKQKILYISVRADIGGGPFHINQLFENFLVDFDIFCAAPLEPPFGHKWKSELKENHFFELGHRSFSFVTWVRLASFIKSNNIRLVHSHGKGAGIYSRLLKLLNPKIKVIHTFHGFHPYNKKLSEKIYILFERIFGHLTDHFINVSNGERDLCLKYNILNDKNSSVIYNGIKDSNFNVVDKITLRKKLGLAIDKFIVVSVNRLDQHKNVGQILKIAGKLKDQQVLQFIIVGDGEERVSLEAEARNSKLTNVVFVGFKENAQEFISVSDVYISTSKGEALGYSLIEAQMLGVPVFASNVMGHNEIITNNLNGFLFEPDDINNVTELLLNCLDNKFDLNKIIQNGRSNFIQRFTIDKMLNNLKQLYRKFLH